METYALVVKKEYEDLIDQYAYNEYLLNDIAYNIDEIKSKEFVLRKNLDLLLNNNFDGKGIFNCYEIKILPLKGKYNYDQVQHIFNQVKEKIFLEQDNSKNKH